MPHLQEFPPEGSREIIEHELDRQERRKASEAPRATAGDITRLLGDMSEARISAILDLEPTIADLEQTAMWQQGYGDVLGKAGQPLAGRAAAIFDILEPDWDDGEP